MPISHEERKQRRRREERRKSVVSEMNVDTMGVEILFPVWNRLEFTKQSLKCLAANTNWNLITKMVVYDDGSTDGAGEWANQFCRELPVPSFEYREVTFHAPAAIMNDFLASCEAPLFAKVDNDIAMPPGWLDVLYDVMARNPRVELLGCEYGQALGPREGWDGEYQAMPCRHIGGVGLMRTETFFRNPPLASKGRSGFTEFQHRFKPPRSWVSPDMPVVQLDRVPEDPWWALSQKYIANGWQRSWGAYAEDDQFWRWMEEIK